MVKNKKTILIIEDERHVADLLENKFKKEGVAVLRAGDGERGLELARTKKPDLILLDIIMPKMDGITMLKELRKDKWGKGAKVVILTNLSDGVELSEALSQGAYDFLVKADWRLEDVVKKVKEKLEM